jgi:hypothetical protein
MPQDLKKDREPAKQHGLGIIMENLKGDKGENRLWEETE